MEPPSTVLKDTPAAESSSEIPLRGSDFTLSFLLRTRRFRGGFVYAALPND